MKLNRNVFVISSAVNRKFLSSRHDLRLIEPLSILNWRIDGRQVPKSPIQKFSSEDYEYILSELKQLTPIFSRHFGTLDDLDYSLRFITLQILSLVEALESIKADTVVMHFSGSSHLLLDNMLEIAATSANVLLVFFRPVGQDRVLAMVQNRGIGSRTVLKFSQTEALNSEIRRSIDEGWFQPVASLSTKLGHSPNTEYAHALIQQLKRLFIVTFRSNMRRTYNADREILSPISPIRDISLIQKQKTALKYLHRLEKEHRSQVLNLLQNSNSVNLCIYAHLEPEMTVFPEGGKLNGVIEIVIKLRSLGFQQPILIREHPTTQNFNRGTTSFRIGTTRSKNYYEALERMGCLFAHPEDKELIERRAIAVTIVGNVAIQRSLSGKPSIFTGFPWYRGMPGTFDLQDSRFDFEALRQSIDTVAARDFLANLLTGSTLPTKPFKRDSNLGSMDEEGWITSFNTLLNHLKKLEA